MFQHTAARRRLVQPLGFIFVFGASFNTQPPEGGWMGLCGKLHMETVSTHSRPKAAGWSSFIFLVAYMCFNTQPPEGGWTQIYLVTFNLFSFNTQPPEGGWIQIWVVLMIRVSFNTQPPEGGWEEVADLIDIGNMFQHTAARRRLEPLSKALFHQVSRP